MSYQYHLMVMDNIHTRFMLQQLMVICLRLLRLVGQVSVKNKWFQVWVGYCQVNALES